MCNARPLFYDHLLLLASFKASSRLLHTQNTCQLTVIINLGPQVCQPRGTRYQGCFRGVAWRGPGTVVFGKARVILLYAAFAALLTSISTRKIVAFLGIAVTCAKGRGFFIQWMRCIIYIQSSAEGLACACLTSKCWQKSEFLLSMEETVQYNCINCIHNLKALRNVLVLPLRVYIDTTRLLYAIRLYSARLGI